MRTIVYQRHFKRDYKKFQKNGRNMARFVEAIQLLQQGDPLPAIYRDHQLSGNWKDFNECHLGGDFLLIYRFTANELHLVRMGSHSQLFG
jgi:mRNA interferase YafQ